MTRKVSTLDLFYVIMVYTECHHNPQNVRTSKAFSYENTVFHIAKYSIIQFLDRL